MPAQYFQCQIYVLDFVCGILEEVNLPQYNNTSGFMNLNKYVEVATILYMDISHKLGNSTYKIFFLKAYFIAIRGIQNFNNRQIKYLIDF